MGRWVRCAVLAGGVMIGALGAKAEVEMVHIDATAVGEPISPYVYGQFIEHLGRCIYGGIWAEMLEDRKFFYPVDGEKPGWAAHAGDTTTWQGEGVAYEILVASPWQIIGPKDSVRMSTDAPYAGAHMPVIAPATGVVCGIYHPRLGLETGRRYTGRIVMKATGDVGPVEVALAWGDGAAGEAVMTISPSGEFDTYPFAFTSGGDSSDGRLAVRCRGAGAICIGAVSLMPENHVDGFRRDTLALLRELDSPIYRWPGGNFVSGYDWRDGVGDRDRRPPRKNPAWTGIEHNDVGIHEFLRLCELLKTEPYIALNTGLGDVSSAASEVEYITGGVGTVEGAKRAANGRSDPWAVTWWAVGNEMYGDWQLGHLPLDAYVKKHNAFVDAIRAASPSARVVGVGHAGAWSEAMLTHCTGHMDLISEHLYWQHKPDVREHVQAAVGQIETLANTHRKYREDLEPLAGKDIRIALDEWNYWYGPYRYGELGVRYFMRDALGVAAALHAMFRNSDLYFMANYAQTVNVIGAIKTTPTDAFFETTGQVLKLYRHEFGTIPVRVTSAHEGLDVAAAWTADRSVLTVGIVQMRNESSELELTLTGMAMPTAAVARVIQHSDPDAYNDETSPQNVAINDTTVDLSTGRFTVQPYSITLLRLKP